MGKPLHYDVHGQLCLLAMDDDQINLMVVEQLLAPQGWRVRHVRRHLGLLSLPRKCIFVEQVDRLGWRLWPYRELLVGTSKHLQFFNNIC